MRSGDSGHTDGTPSQGARPALGADVDPGFRPYDASRRRSSSQEQRASGRQERSPGSPQALQQGLGPSASVPSSLEGARSQHRPGAAPGQMPLAVIPPREASALAAYGQPPGMPPTSLHSLQTFIQHQQHHQQAQVVQQQQHQQQRQMYLQQQPYMPGMQSTASMPPSAMPLAPTLPQVAAFGSVSMSPGYTTEYNVNPTPALAQYGSYGLRQPFQPFPSLTGHEPAWNQEGPTQLRTTSQEHQQSSRQELMAGMRNFAMREALDEGPAPAATTQSQSWTPSAQPAESIPEPSKSNTRGSRSPAARKRKLDQPALSLTSPLAVPAQEEEMTHLTSKSSAEGEGMTNLEYGGEGIDSQERIRRRLAQNREAARKSRQRRKKYITDLESEVHRLRQQEPTTVSASQLPPTSSGEGPASPPAFGASPGPLGPGPSAPGPAPPGRSGPYPPQQPQPPGPYDTPMGRLHLRGPSAISSSYSGAGGSGPAGRGTMGMQPMPPTCTPMGPIPGDIQSGSHMASSTHLSSMPALPPSEGTQLAQTALTPLVMHPGQQHDQQATAIVSAFNRWRLEHALVAIRIRNALNHQASESILRPLVEEARGQLRALFAMKKTLLASKDATIIMWCSHQPPAERMLGWLGGFRPSLICTGLLRKLGPDLSEHGRTRLETLRESLLQQEGMLAHGFDELSSSLLLTAASQALHVENGQLLDQQCWASPDTFGKLDTLRVTLQRADQIWDHMLEQTEQNLPLRQHAVAVIAMAETSVTLESLQNPWLNLLFQTPMVPQQSTPMPMPQSG